MIYTVTLNPALDYNAVADTYDYGKTNRTHSEYIVPGGKGLNVSVVLNRLGLQNTALGFCAGFTGDEVLRRAAALGCNCDFIKVSDGFTRINVKLMGDAVTEFNGSGITLTDNDINVLCEKLGHCKPDDIVVFSGSTPRGTDDEIYLTLCEKLPCGVKTVVDTTGKKLRAALRAKPFLIKPNIDELCDLFGCEISGEENIIKYAELLKCEGAQNVLISLGGDGAILLDQNGNVHMSRVPKGKMINTVGAGDSMIAGFIHAYITENDFAFALKEGIASGSATAFSPTLAEKSDILKLLEQLNQ